LNRANITCCARPIPSDSTVTPDWTTHDYVCHGTTSLFAAVDIATDKIIGQTSDGTAIRTMPWISQGSQPRQGDDATSGDVDGWMAPGGLDADSARRVFTPQSP
jgi:hypothetical protein